MPSIAPALETVRLALSNVSPIEAAALTLGWALFFVAVAHRRPVATLNTRLASEAERARKVTR